MYILSLEINNIDWCEYLLNISLIFFSVLVIKYFFSLLLRAKDVFSLAKSDSNGILSAEYLNRLRFPTPFPSFILEFQWNTLKISIKIYLHNRYITEKVVLNLFHPCMQCFGLNKLNNHVVMRKKNQFQHLHLWLMIYEIKLHKIWMQKLKEHNFLHRTAEFHQDSLINGKMVSNLLIFATNSLPQFDPFLKKSVLPEVENFRTSKLHNFGTSWHIYMI